MSHTTAEEEENQPKQLPQCGRLVFRGVELAYLNIDGEYMMPLAELLALVLPSTPRTTLFTRMEKMKVRRHFCQPEEIKLLKTVNGIHGSSANCTLLSKTEVDKYCSIYVDKPNESHRATTTWATIDLDGVESKDYAKETVTEVRQVMKSPRNNNENSSKLAVLHKHKRSPQFKAKLKLTKLANTKKLHLGFSRDRHENQTVTGGEDLLNIDGNLTYSSCNGCVKAFLPDSSQHMTNSTQTVSMLNRPGKKSAKERDQVRNVETNQTHGKKRPLYDDDHEQVVQSPLKIPKMSELNGRKEIDKDGKTSQFRCSLTKHEFDGLISDSSSNDSGFASSALSNPSTPTKSDFSAGELNGLLKKDEQTIKDHTSTYKVKIETPKRSKPKEIEGNSLTLSPPALLLKRHENSWQVQQKSDEGTKYSAQKREVETKKSTRPVRLAAAFDLCLSASQSFSEKKQSKKERKRRKSLSGKGEVWIKSQATKNVITENVEVEIEAKKNLKAKHTRKGKGLLAEETLFNNLNSSTAKKKKLVEVSRESTPEEKQLELDKLAREERLKQEAVLDKLAEDALASYLAPSSKPSSSLTEPKKPKVTTKSAVSKKNYNFKLLNLFPVMSPLSLHNGTFGPSFTLSFPSGTEPSASHPLWKWTLGGPVDRSTNKTIKKPAAQRTEPQSSKSTFKKMPILKTRKRKLSAFRKALSSKGKDFSRRSAFNSGQCISTIDFAKKSSLSAETCVSLIPM